MLGFNHIGRHGRLGNQMFQVAATACLARKKNVEFMGNVEPTKSEQSNIKSTNKDQTIISTIKNFFIINLYGVCLQ